MTEIIDRSYFAQLEQADPESICRRGRCRFLADRCQYCLDVWGDQYLIDPEALTVECISKTGLPPHEYLAVFVMYYLLGTKDVPLTGEWISEKDLAGGPTFFRGPHQIPTELITKRFDNDLQKFKTLCKEFGGTPIEMADAAFSFSITPDIPVAVLYWIGDEDFPAEAKILYDRSITELLSLDILFALAVGVCARFGTTE